jgi:ferrochelatase
LLVVPISFVSEHIETLQEIDIEYRELAEEAGIHNFHRVPALNTHPVFIDSLATLRLLKPSKPLAACFAVVLIQRRK